MSESQSKSKFSILNAISALVMTFINGLFGIVVTRFIIEKFGSDFNGLNSTANQIVNVLLLLEGGFTVASNVALFTPLGERDLSLVNGILAATRHKFRKIGIFFFALGTTVSIGYTFAVNSSLPKDLIFAVLWMTVIPAAFNLFFATTYRVLLQAQQKEFIINSITALTIGLGHVINIILIIHNGQMWMVRFVTMTFSLINSFLISFYALRHNAFLNFQSKERGELIKGTNDVLIQKITGVIYSAAPIVFLSISPAGGTVLASVYAVYNNVFAMLKSLLHAVIDAPRLSFGQLLTEHKREDIWPVFSQYEYLAFLVVAILLTTTHALILPFVTLYTSGITDTNYLDPIIALLMVWITAVEMSHIPSGHLINMAGKFKVSRNIQLVACAALFFSMPIGGFLWGIYGMLCALLFVAILFALFEIGYVHTQFFPGKLAVLLKMLLPIMIICIFIGWIEPRFLTSTKNTFSFIKWGFLLGSVNSCIILFFGILLQREIAFTIFRRLFHITVNH